MKQAVLAAQCFIAAASFLLTSTAQAQECIDLVTGEPAQCGPSECTDDAKACQDGSFVSRDPRDGCQFFPCPEVCINPITGEPDVPVTCLVDPCELSEKGTWNPFHVAVVPPPLGQTE